MRHLFFVLLVACGKTAEPAASAAPTSTPPPAAQPSSCSRSKDCAVGHHFHPCCLEDDGSTRCFALAPKAHGCPGREVCQVDADCMPDEKCVDGKLGKKLCQGGKAPSGPVIPGKCINRAPNAPPDPECERLGK